MLQVLQHSYVFAVVAALATAALAYSLARVTEPDATRAYRTFYKTLASGLLAGTALAWVASSRPEPLATVPFDAVAGGLLN